MSKIITAYRIEGENGWGPHRGDNWELLRAALDKEYLIISWSHIWNSFPTPYNEANFGKLKMDGKICAFSSVDVMVKTMPKPIIKVCVECGFRIYRVKFICNDEVFVGKYQTVYPKNIEFIEKIDLTSILFLDFKVKNNIFTVKI